MINEYESIPIHLDNLRREANIKKSTFVEDVCSERQYTRYLNGSQEIGTSKLRLFCEKLGFTPREFYKSFYTKEAYEVIITMDLHRKIANRDYKSSATLINRISSFELTSQQSKSLFEYCKIRYNLETSQITELYALDKFSKVISYPFTGIKKHYTFVDILCLLAICKIESNNNKFTALDHLSELLKDNSMIYLSSESETVIPSVYSTILRLLYEHKRYDEIINMSAPGIKYCIRRNKNHSLEHMYYYRSIAFYYKEDFTEFRKNSYLAITTTISKSNRYMFEILYDAYTNHFNHNPIKDIEIDLIFPAKKESTD